MNCQLILSSRVTSRPTLYLLVVERLLTGQEVTVHIKGCHIVWFTLVVEEDNLVGNAAVLSAYITL